MIRNALVVEAKVISESELVKIEECAVIADRKRIASIRVLENELWRFIGRSFKLLWDGGGRN